MSNDVEVIYRKLSVFAAYSSGNVYRNYSLYKGTPINSSVCLIFSLLVLHPKLVLRVFVLVSLVLRNLRQPRFRNMSFNAFK